MTTPFPTRIATNTTDLRSAIFLGCVPMERNYDPDRERLPYFGNQVVGPAVGSFHFENYSIAHVPGRWLNALLSAEAVTGRPADEAAIATLAVWTYRAFGGAFPLAKFIDPETLEVLPRADLHNLREGMHALYALTAFRGDERARLLAEAHIALVAEYFDDETGTWDEARFAAAYAGETTFTCGHSFTFPIAFGRMIGSVVKYQRATGSPAAAALTRRLAGYALEHVVVASGRYDVEIFGEHVHSTTAMLSSLAQFAEATGDERALNHLEAFVANGLTELAMELGWCLENFFQKNNWGEGNNTVDLIEMFMILGRLRDPAYFRRAERMLRAHLLPSQLIETYFIDDEEHADFGTSHLATQVHGAFGFPTPWGHEEEPGATVAYNWDIVGGVVGGLAEVLRSIVTHEGNATTIALHFNHRDDLVEWTGPAGPGAPSTLRVAEARRVRVLLPAWADAEELLADLALRGVSATLDGPWLSLDATPEHGRIELDLRPPVVDTHLSFRTTELDVRSHGDFVLAMNTEGKRLRFFDEL